MWVDFSRVSFSLRPVGYFTSGSASVGVLSTGKSANILKAITPLRENRVWATRDYGTISVDISQMAITNKSNYLANYWYTKLASQKKPRKFFIA